MTYNLFGLSGGKDSTRLVAWAIHESGYDRASLIFTFCDTENEYDEVYDQIRALDEYVQRHGCRPVVYLRAAGQWVDKYWMFPLFLALAIWKGRFPSAKVRFCTDFLKIRPTVEFFKTLASEGGPPHIVSHSGVRADESIERSTMQEWSTGMLGVSIRRPLLKLTIAEVWDGHRKYALPINKLYLLGWKRVGCRLCIMSNKQDVRRTAKKRPWVIAVYRTWELVVGAYRKARGNITDYSSWFHRKTVPERHRSRWVETKKIGMVKVCTIDDVAAWSMTARGGNQHALFHEEDFNEDDANAPCQSGYCE